MNRAGACDQCVIELRCCSFCWCCPWPKWWTHCHEAVVDRDWDEQPCGKEIAGTTQDPEGAYPVCREHLRPGPGTLPFLRLELAELLARRPDLRGALPLRPLAEILVDAVLAGA